MITKLTVYETIIGVMVSALGIRARGPGFHYSIGLQPWASCLLTLPPWFLSQLQETGVQNGVFRRLCGYGD